jgi:hypothetical protein
MDKDAKGNKGEWSELYVLLKLLADGFLPQGMADLSLLDAEPYKVIGANREEKSDGGTVIKSYAIKDDVVSVFTDGKHYGDVAIADLACYADGLFSEILKATGSSFTVSEEACDYLSSVSCGKIKADAQDKVDIHVKIHDSSTGTDPNLGFSIKSQLGAASTLINASKDNTNFRYRLNGNIDKEFAETINAISPRQGKIQARIAALAQRGIFLEFDRVLGEVYNNNLLLLDSDLSKILSECLIRYYSGGGAVFLDIVQSLDVKNPLNYPSGKWPYYSFKLKKFLVESALGMMPAKPWSGIYDATGGYIVVKSDGEIVSYHLIRKNLFEDYLLANVKLDTPSSGRHKFGEVYYDENSQAFFNLNLQVRFLH